MLRLIEPCEAYLASYTEAFTEYESYPRRAGNPYNDPRTCHLLNLYRFFAAPLTCRRAMSPPPPTGWWMMKSSVSWGKSASATS